MRGKECKIEMRCNAERRGEAKQGQCNVIDQVGTIQTINPKP